MKYQIAEAFYSVIREGEFSGQDAFFIHLAPSTPPTPSTCQMTPEELFEEALKHPSRIVIITGSTIHPLKPLTDVFRKSFKIHLETDGMVRPDSFDFDWISVSPKNKSVDLSLLGYASQVLNGSLRTWTMVS